MQLILRKLSQITSSYFFVIVTSIVLGLYIGTVYPSFVNSHPNISLLALAGIFFLSSLKIELQKVFEALSDKLLLVVVIVFMLIALPFGVYYATAAIFPTLAISFLLLAAMPSGMTAPFLTELAGGKQGLALVLTVVTSLLAPFTVPTVVYLAAGHEVGVNFFDMFVLLAEAIFIPFVAAQIIKRYAQKTVDSFSFSFRFISTVLLGILIIFVIAKRPTEVMQVFSGGETLIYILGLTILFLVFHVLGYYTIFWRHKQDRITIAVCLTYMNFTLAIVLADRFFADTAHIVVPTVLSVLPWAFFFIPFRRIIQENEFLKV